MELTLNLVWLAIAAAAFVKLTLWARNEGDRRQVVLVTIATVCALAVLFPVVSISDDLETTSAVLEDHASVRRTIESAALHVIPLTYSAVVFIALVRATLAFIGVPEEKPRVLQAYDGACPLSRRGPPAAGC